jgi:hypothetical protein
MRARSLVNSRWTRRNHAPRAVRGGPNSAKLSGEVVVTLVSGLLESEAPPDCPVKGFACPETAAAATVNKKTRHKLRNADLFTMIS